MDLTWVPWFFVGVVGVVVAVLLWVGFRFAQAMRRAAAALDIEWTDGGVFSPGELVGEVEGENVNVRVRTLGYGSLQRVRTIVEVDLTPPLGVSFQIGRASLLHRLGHSVGLHDVEFEDPEFDHLYQVRAADPDALRPLFHGGTRLALVGFAEGSSDVRVTPSRIRWERMGRVLDADTIVRVVKQGVVTAKCLRGGVS